MTSGSILLLLLMLAVVYALMILPQRRQQRARAEMLKQLGPGAKILTTAGIFGKITQLTDDVMVVKVAGDVEVEMDPRAVLRVVEPAPTTQTEE